MATAGSPSGSKRRLAHPPWKPRHGLVRAAKPVLSAAEAQLAKSREALKARQDTPDSDAAAKAVAQKTEDEEAKRLQEMIVKRPDCFTPKTVAEARRSLGAQATGKSPRRDWKADAVAACQDKGRQTLGKAAAYFAPDPVIVGGPQGNSYRYTIIGQNAPEPTGPYQGYECTADLYVNGGATVTFMRRQ